MRLVRTVVDSSEAGLRYIVEHVEGKPWKVLIMDFGYAR
jgi:hypothetical protein